MELRELGNRLFRLHAKLILALVIVGVLVGLVIQAGSKREYQASALFTMGVTDPQSAEVAGVLADTARGIATGPQLVDQAISQIGVARSETAVASSIVIQTLGSSGVVMLSVADRDPQVAIRLANALADGVVSTRANLIQNGKTESLQSLNQQENATDLQIKSLTSQIGGLAGRSSTAAIAELSALEARLTSLQALDGQIIVEKTSLEAQLGPQAEVIDKAVTVTGVRGRQLDNALLGAVLGLVLGIAVAAVREAGWPSLVGSAAVARTVGAPLLGEMSTPPANWTVAALPDAGSYVELAAESKSVREVRFATIEPKRRRQRAQVRMLGGPLQQLRFDWPQSSNPSSPPADVGPSAARAPAAAALTAPPAADQNGRGPVRTGLVVAVPRVLKAADVDALINFTWISGWILLGVITYPPPRKTITARPRDSGSDRSTLAESLNKGR